MATDTTFPVDVPLISRCGICGEAFIISEDPADAAVERLSYDDFVHVACIGTTRCEACGKLVKVGEWPKCPHGFGNNLEAPLEPYDDRNLTDGVVRVTTRSERRKLMAQNHLEYVPKAERLHSRLFFDMKR